MQHAHDRLVAVATVSVRWLLCSNSSLSVALLVAIVHGVLRVRVVDVVIFICVQSKGGRQWKMHKQHM